MESEVVFQAIEANQVSLISLCAVSFLTSKKAAELFPITKI